MKMKLRAMGSEREMAIELVKQANILNCTENKLRTALLEKDATQKQLKETQSQVQEFVTRFSELEQQLNHSEKEWITQTETESKQKKQTILELKKSKDQCQKYAKREIEYQSTIHRLK